MLIINFLRGNNGILRLNNQRTGLPSVNRVCNDDCGYGKGE